MKPRGSAEDPNWASEIAVQALVFLAEDNERMGSFLALSGIAPSSIREAAREPGFLAGVLDHVMANESLLISLADNSGLHPDHIAQARAILAGSAFD